MEGNELSRKKRAAMMPESVESAFSYQGVPRLSYFWANPNHAVAVLVAFIGIFWVLRVAVAPRGWFQTGRRLAAVPVGNA
jgi:hypothetical protein